MDWGGPGFVIALVAITTLGWIVNNWIRARHGFEPTDDWGRVNGKVEAINRRLTGRGGGDLDDARKIMLLSNENDKLVAQVGRLEERLHVLERIATDPATRTAREIDALR